MNDIKQRLSLLWLFVLLNYLYADVIAQALRTFGASSADFADCLIERTSAAKGCEKTMTFDTGAAKFAGMTLIT